MLKDNYTKTGVLFGAFLLANLVLTCLWHFIDGLELRGMLLGLVKVEFSQKTPSKPGDLHGTGSADFMTGLVTVSNCRNRPILLSFS